MSRGSLWRRHWQAFRGKKVDERIVSRRTLLVLLTGYQLITAGRVDGWGKGWIVGPALTKKKKAPLPLASSVIVQHLSRLRVPRYSACVNENEVRDASVHVTQIVSSWAPPPHPTPLPPPPQPFSRFPFSLSADQDTSHTEHNFYNHIIDFFFLGRKNPFSFKLHL